MNPKILLLAPTAFILLPISHFLRLHLNNQRTFLEFYISRVLPFTLAALLALQKIAADLFKKVFEKFSLRSTGAMFLTRWGEKSRGLPEFPWIKCCRVRTTSGNP